MPLSALLPDLSRVLDAREARWAERERLAAEGTVLSATVRAPHALRLANLELLAEADDAIRAAGFVPVSVRFTADGPEALYRTEKDARAAKKAAIALEDGLAFGRFLDLDVTAKGGGAVSRRDLRFPGRRCLVCGRPAWECTRSKAHGPDEAGQALEAARWPETADPAWRIARAASLAAQEELRLLVKPGLVTPLSRGSHEDMDFSLMLKALGALEGWWRECAAAGLAAGAASPALLAALRPRGIEAEKEMMRATGGVNAYRGLIYLLGILCAAAGACGKEGAEAVFAAAAAMCAGEASRPTGTDTRAKRRGFRFPGARGEAAAGFPSVRAALGFFEEERAAGTARPDAAAGALLLLISRTDDSNVAGRGGLEGLSWIKGEARRVLGLGGLASEAGTRAYSDFCRKAEAKRLSPGGSADLLACALFISRLKNID